MASGADISGLLKGLKKAREAKLKAAVRAVEIFGSVKILGNAQSLCPVKTGALQLSDTFEPAELDGTKITMEVGFNTNYAAAVHERTELHHDIGQAKFLETPMRLFTKDFAPFVGAEVAKAE